jgi:Starch-binding associating with outer membrane
MKGIKNIYWIVTGALLFASCSKTIQDKQSNPNAPTTVPSALILGTVLNDMSGELGSSNSGSLGGINSWDLVHGWNQYHCQNYDYYGNNIYAWTDGSLNSAGGSAGPFNSYLVLKNVVQMENAVVGVDAGHVNPYEAIGRFVRAYYYYNMTSLMGDIPQTEALEAQANPTPAYTPQEQVFGYILNELDTANSDFATLITNNDNTLSASQDLFYAGNLAAWQKLVNSFKLRVLVSLSLQSSDANLNVPARFAAVINNPATYPIFASPSDDFEYNYNPGASNTFSTYPFNPSNFGSIAGRYNMAYTYVNALTSINDARVFMTCDPAWALVTADTAAADSSTKYAARYKYFLGASTGLDMGTMYSNASAGDYSFIGRYRYYSNFTGDPNVLVGYKEMCFNIAEAIERGWIAGNAETWYKQGITTSMAFYGINVADTSFTAHFLPAGESSLSQIAPYPFTFNFAKYYAQPAVQLSATAAMAINQIVLQKYIATFENSGYEAYYNWRRTGVPAFQGGSGVGNNGVIPLRWAYPVSEQTQNAKNWAAAISSQGFTADDLNQTMWLLK